MAETIILTPVKRGYVYDLDGEAPKRCDLCGTGTIPRVVFWRDRKPLPEESLERLLEHYVHLCADCLEESAWDARSLKDQGKLG